MSYKSEDEAHVAIELVSMRNGRGSVSFDNSPAPTFTRSASAINQPSPTTAAVSDPSPSSSAGTKKRSKSSSSAKPSSSAASKTQADNDDADASAKKRRRVVVACDTCRRKKIKCQGLPNPTNTCNNCTAYNYRCTFSSDADRSRGKYEILESKVETLLSALRSVAPHVATQFERGELNVIGPSGSSAPPQNANPWQSLQPHDKHPPQSLGGVHRDSLSRHPQDLPSNSATRLGRGGSDPDDADAPPDPPGSAGASTDGSTKQEREALLPDVEDGRPRYFGRSSAMTLFHSIASESRPPSPTPDRNRSIDPGDHAGISYETHRHQTSRHATSSSSANPATTGGISPSGAAKPSATAPRALYPTNSKQWIQLLRRKNTVAVGRDDAVTEEWFERYTLPDRDLIKDLFDVFFQQLHPLMPIVHRPSLERDLATGRADKDSAFRGFVFTILAIASRFSKDPRVLADSGDPDTAGDHFAAASRLYHQVYAASLINVQVMILTATFMHGAIGPGASWTVLGVAIRALQDIGLHQEKAYRGFSPYEQELRRRVFWGAFILDCIFSINMGRPLALKLSDCDVKLPLEIDDEALFQYESGCSIPSPRARAATDEPIVMSGFIHMIKLNVIVQDVVHVLYSPRWRIDGGTRGKPSNDPNQRVMPEYKDMVILSKRLEEWVAETPSHLRSIDSPFRLQAGLVQCGTHDIRLYILKPFLEHSALRKMLHPRCVFHARECLRVVIALHEGEHMSDLVFIFQQAFMSTATFMITVWHECHQADKLAEDNDLIESTLRIFAAFDDRYFSRLFRRAHRILRDIALRSMHTMTSDQRERVSRMLVSADQRIAGVSPVAMLGSKPTMQPRGDATLPPSARLAARKERLDRRGSIHAAGDMAGGGAGQYGNDPISAASYIHSWSPIPSAPMSPNHRNSISDASYGGGAAADNHHPPHAHAHAHHPITPAAFTQFMMNSSDASATSADGAGMDDSTSMHGSVATEDGTAKAMAIHPASFGDARGIMPFYAGDDAGSVAHQLEDLSWTDYFSKFLDDISGTGASTVGMGVGSQHAASNLSNVAVGGSSNGGGGGGPSPAYSEMPFTMISPHTPATMSQHHHSPHRPPPHV